MKTMICLDHLAYSYQNYELFNSINETVKDSLEEICLVPFNASRLFMNINTAVYNVGEMGSFNNGLLITNSIKHVKKLLSCPSDTIKALYLYDLEWLFEPFDFEELYNMLTDEDLKLIVRSEDFIEPLKCVTDRVPDAIVPDFKLEKIWNSL